MRDARAVEMRIFRLKDGKADGSLIRRIPQGYNGVTGYSVIEDEVANTGGRFDETDAMFRMVTIAFEEGWRITAVNFFDGGDGCSGQADYGQLYGDH